MEITDLLKKLLESAQIIELHGEDCPHQADYETWTQVAKLAGEDVVKHKAYIADLEKAKSAIEVAIAKAEAAKASAISQKTEWWAYIREKYQLPARLKLHLADDGRILAEQEDKP